MSYKNAYECHVEILRASCTSFHFTLTCYIRCCHFIVLGFPLYPLIAQYLSNRDHPCARGRSTPPLPPQPPRGVALAKPNIGGGRPPQSRHQHHAGSPGRSREHASGTCGVKGSGKPTSPQKSALGAAANSDCPRPEPTFVAASKY